MQQTLLILKEQMLHSIRKTTYEHLIIALWIETFVVKEKANITYVILMSWPLIAISFLLLNYWLFFVQLSYHI